MRKACTLFLLVLFFNVGIYSQEGNSVKLLFLGDIMGHGPQIKAAYNAETNSYNYDSSFN